MKLSVIIPCHPRNLPQLSRTLDSVATASAGLEVEQLVIHDEQSRGLSWARNQGLGKATGDLVFFVDADDTVRAEYFRRLSTVMADSDADFALSSFEVAPLKRDYTLKGNDEIRAAMMPAFFGYSFEDVRRWNAGGSISERRELGGVWRGAYRRDFLNRWNIRFDENLRLYEDSPFIAECAARAEKTVSIPDILYEYVPGPNGILATSLGTDRYFNYKFAALENRKAIAARAGGDLMQYFAGSAVFSALELLKARRFDLLKRYLKDEFVRQSLRDFPTAINHPLTWAAVKLLCCRL